MLPLTFENELTFLRMKQDGREDAFHEAYDRAVKEVRDTLGGDHALRIGGEPVSTGDTFQVVNPGKTSEVIGTFASATASEVDQAVATAKETWETTWRTTPWEERVEVFERAAEIMRERKYHLAATMTLENGKNRAEALADVDEAIDFLDFYSQQMREHDGWRFDTGQPTPWEHTHTVLRPYGVFAVVAPFNFPLAILVGMTTGATITGNTAVVKPASATPFIAHAFLDIMEAAGLPDGVINLVTGRGSQAGQPLLEHEDVQGIVFTGSVRVGKEAQRLSIEKEGGAFIAELGGKNAVLVTENAELDAAVEGVMKGAFGFDGQKCSATSRAYVHESLYDDFVERLVASTGELQVGRPEKRGTFMGPVIEEGKVQEFQEAVQDARDAGATIATGGEVPQGGVLDEGHYVTPTVITDLPLDHELWETELFLPIVKVAPYSEWDEAMHEINKTRYALTSGIFSQDPEEVERYFDEVEAGVVYANRRSSATTGALVQAQPFGGWKLSGTTGKAAGGTFYLPQFMRQQSRTEWKEPEG